MKIAKFALYQFCIFVSVAVIFRYTYFPFDSWIQSPNWAVTLGYGGLFVLPIWLNRKNPRLLIGLAGCLSVWFYSIYLKVTDGEFIAHVTTLYMASAVICALAHGYRRYRFDLMVLGGFSAVLSLWGLFLVNLYGVRGDVATWAVLGHNLVFFLQLIAPCLRIKDGPEIAKEGGANNEEYAPEYREAA